MEKMIYLKKNAFLGKKQKRPKNSILLQILFPAFSLLYISVFVLPLFSVYQLKFIAIAVLLVQQAVFIVRIHAPAVVASQSALF